MVLLCLILGENRVSLAKSSRQVLKVLYENAEFTTIYTVSNKHGEMSTELGINREAYNLHLRRLKNKGYIRIGQGFVDITEKGLNAIGVSTKPSFILIKASPNQEIVSTKLKETICSIFEGSAQVEALIVRGGDDLLLKGHPFSSIERDSSVSEKQCNAVEEK
jgi:hypothetical protein